MGGSVNAETKCWICRRKAKEVLESIQMSETSEEFAELGGWDYFIKEVSIADFPKGEIKVPVCIVCINIIRFMSVDFIEDIIDASIEEILTTKDRLKVVVE